MSSAAKTTRYIAKCRACNCVTSALSVGNDCHKSLLTRTPGTVYTNPMGFFVIDCRVCGQQRHAFMVRGKYSAKHVCSAKCMASTGHVCECSCAGKNHGASHASVQP